jgi:hypothetical protein
MMPIAADDVIPPTFQPKACSECAKIEPDQLVPHDPLRFHTDHVQHWREEPTLARFAIRTDDYGRKFVILSVEGSVLPV